MTYFAMIIKFVGIYSLKKRIAYKFAKHLLISFAEKID